MELSCKDCKFYLPVDVFRGMCKLMKKDIGPDNAFCEKGEKLAKCRFCAKYTGEKDYLGKCMSVTLAYPDMVASKCADFEWTSRN